LREAGIEKCYNGSCVSGFGGTGELCKDIFFSNSQLIMATDNLLDNDSFLPTPRQRLTLLGFAFFFFKI
jgi:hypothetical protein